MQLEQIKAHWEKSGREFPAQGLVTPTSRDPYLGELERENILAHLNPRFKCLEIGCGDASHTVHYARRVSNLDAIDVADSLIEIARQRGQPHTLRNVEWEGAA